ncbi:MAG TPA: hypothetical protein VGR47_20165 [Terracidiphilus sp.]|nr:hypothetical protein [Terracidiphilus sp.]
MDSPDPEDRKAKNSDPDEPSKGPSLIVMYSLIALAILVATAIAALIVLPFYLRR